MQRTKRRGLAALVLLVLTAGGALARAPTDIPRRSPRTDRYDDPLPAGAIARIGSVRWWHGQSGQNCPLLFAADGKNLVCSEQNTVRILDTATGKELRRLRHPGGEVTTFALSPDGKTLVTATSQAPVIWVWNFSTGKERRQLTFEKPGTRAIAFSPDGKTLAAATGQKDIQLWEVATWRATRQLRGHKGSITSLCFLPDGKTLISGGGTCRTMLWWEVATGREIRRLDTGRLAHRRHLVLSPDGKRLAAFVRPNVLVLWDARTGAEIRRTVLKRKDGVWCLSFSPDSRTLACGNAGTEEDHQTRFFEPATGKELRCWNHDSYTAHLAYSPDGKVLACTDSNRLRLRDATTGKMIPSISDLPSYPLAVRFTPDGKGLIASCFDGHAGSWDPLTGKPLTPLRPPPKAFPGPSRMLLATALTGDGQKAAAVDGKGVLHVWATFTGKVCCRINDPVVGEDQPVFSPDGRALVIKHKDRVIRVWDLQTGKVRFSLPQPASARFPHPHAFSPDGRLLATASGRQDESAIQLWDIATGKVVGELAWEDNTQPTHLLFTPDGKRLVVAHSPFYFAAQGEPGPNSVRIWDLASQREVLRLPFKWFDIRRALALSPDGRTLAATDYKDIVLWEMASGQVRGRFSGHRDWAWSLAFSPDGRLLASGALDYTALVWDVTGVCPDGKWSPRVATTKEVERLWADLAGEGERAFRAVWMLARAGKSSVSFLADPLRPVAPVAEGRLKGLIADLDSNRFADRDRASGELQRLGELAGPALRKALAGRPTPEARRRLERLVQKLGEPIAVPDVLQALRGVEVLEKVGTAEARKVLAKLADGAAGAPLTREANASLKRLKVRASEAP
jgi:WD40 repeat protein